MTGCMLSRVFPAWLAPLPDLLIVVSSVAFRPLSQNLWISLAQGLPLLHARRLPVLVLVSSFLFKCQAALPHLSCQAIHVLRILSHLQ